MCFCAKPGFARSCFGGMSHSMAGSQRCGSLATRAQTSWSQVPCSTPTSCRQVELPSSCHQLVSPPGRQHLLPQHNHLLAAGGGMRAYQVAQALSAATAAAAAPQVLHSRGALSVPLSHTAISILLLSAAAAATTVFARVPEPLALMTNPLLQQKSSVSVSTCQLIPQSGMSIGFHGFCM